MHPPSIKGMEAAANSPCVVEIDTATKPLQPLVAGLLQMTRLESQVVEPQLEWCDVNELVDAAVYTPDDSPAELTVRHAERKLRLIVRNHGPAFRRARKDACSENSIGHRERQMSKRSAATSPAR